MNFQAETSKYSTMKIALVQDWLTGMRGGELVFEAIAELFPHADIFTLIHVPGSVSKQIESHRIFTSSLQKIPNPDRWYRHFLPLMPMMASRFDLSGYDLILSSSHCWAKGVKKAPNALHLAYLHAPMRYMWDRFDDYFGPGRASLPIMLAARVVRRYLQAWDYRVSQPDLVDGMIANSSFIAQQIKLIYGRKADVVFPFADLSRFSKPRNPQNFYLMVGAFAPNKRVDIAIQAFKELKIPLWIVGSGQQEKKLRELAGPETESGIRFLGAKSNEEIAELLSQAKAFVFPGLEDFGITPIEAMAAGTPVIAYRAGGVLDTLTEETALFFDEQNAESLADAVLRFENGVASRIKVEASRLRAAYFTRERFQKEFLDILDKMIGSAKKSAKS